MKGNLKISILMGLMVTAVLGCNEGMGISDPPLESELTVSEFGLPGLSGLSLLQRTSPLTQSYSDTETIQNDVGGWLSIPSAGIDVYVPAGALGSDPDDELTITITAPAGSDVKWSFAPHGTQFDEDLKIHVDASMTNASSVLTLPLLSGLVPDLLGIYFTQGWLGLSVLETFDVDLNSGDFVFETDHFSGYALAM